jgi:integrase/recombinase XerC/integrase/recombinase XerD
MSSQNLRHITQNLLTFGLDHLSTSIQAFLTDKQASGLSPHTISFYRDCLVMFEKFCANLAVTKIEQVDANLIRQYLLHLEQTGHNSTSRHGHYRALRAFMYWLEIELGEDEYRAPIRKVKPPKLPKDLIEGANLEDVQRMVAACAGHTFTALRDKALLLFLLDTGARASETLAIDLNDLDFAANSAFIRFGKGGKQRMVYFGKTTRRALTAYLKTRKDDNPALWVNEQGERFTRYGLDKTLRLRAKQAGISNPPSAHDFRRAFALNMLRSGCDVFTLQRLMGHSDLTVLRRYLAQTESDLQQAHRQHSPVDRLKP